jgi:hypothetical protein
MAEGAGVSPPVLRAVLADNPGGMPPDVALGVEIHAPRSRTMLRPMSIARRS